MKNTIAFVGKCGRVFIRFCRYFNSETSTRGDAHFRVRLSSNNPQCPVARLINPGPHYLE